MTFEQMIEMYGPTQAAHIQATMVGLDAVLDFAKQRGLVVTVTQVPKEPLAMGHYETVAEVRPSRETYRSGND